jgi:hypothetical protein
MEEMSTLIRKKLQSFRIVHLMMVLGDIIYGIVMLYIYKYAPIQPILKDAETISLLEYSSFLVAVTVIAIVIIIRKSMLASDSMFKVKESNKSLDEPVFFANYLSMLFTIWAIIQIIAVIGVVLFLMGGKIIVPLVLIFIAASFKLFNGTRFEELNQLAVKQESILVQK